MKFFFSFICASIINTLTVCAYASLQVLDLSTQTWLPLVVTDKLFLPRGQHSATVIDDNIWVFGGTNYANPSIGELSILNCGLATLGKVPPTPALPKTTASETSETSDAPALPSASASVVVATALIAAGAPPPPPPPPQAFSQPQSQPPVTISPLSSPPRATQLSPVKSAVPQARPAPISPPVPPPFQAWAPALPAHTASVSAGPPPPQSQPQPQFTQPAPVAATRRPAPVSGSATPDSLSFFKQMYNIQF